MGTEYSQFDIDERYELFRLREAGTAQKEMAVLMNRSESTISRELRRNALPKGGYRPGSADRIALSRRRRLSKLERLNLLGSDVRDRLAMGWSPEQIAGRLKLEGSDHSISHGSIYRYIYRPKVRPQKLHRYLARSKATRGRRYFKHRRLPIKNRRSIHERPEAVEKRQEFGHWEGDLMQFRTQRGNLLTLCERKTRFLITAPLKTKTALETGKVLRHIFRRLPEGARHTVTFDNGASSPNMRSWPAKPVFRRSSATRIRPGSAALSRTPMASYAGTCPVKPTWLITPKGTSTTSCGPSTQHPENASAIECPPKRSSKT